MFNSLSRRDLKMAGKVATRYCQIVPNTELMQVHMDISAVKDIAKTQTPRVNFNLKTLLGLNETDFLHDMYGIRTYLNKADGENCSFDFTSFLPRCMRKVAE